MGRMGCVEKVGLRRGPWTPEEDKKLIAYIHKHGPGNWRSVPAKAGLQRCGKSCRLRWTNYLKPDIKRGNFSLEEDRTIIQLHALLGNRWSIIAAHLPKRTDNEVKNYWNTNIKKRFIRMGLDPITHKPKGNKIEPYEAAGHHTKDTINMCHVAQWESARLEAEARGSTFQVGSSSSSHSPRIVISKIPTQPYPSSTNHNNTAYNMYALTLTTHHDLHFPVSTFSFSPDPTNVPLFTQCSSLSYQGNNNNSRTERVMEGYLSNLRDDDEIMAAMEAFRETTSESIPEFFKASTSYMEGLINDSFHGSVKDYANGNFNWMPIFHY